MKNLKTIILVIIALSFFAFLVIRSKKIEAKRLQTSLNMPVTLSDQWQFIGEAVNEPGYDIWGSSPIRDEQGNVHIFCARWPSSTPFKTAWRYKSEIAHYVSENPEGPFHFIEVVRTGKGDKKWNAVGFHNPSIKKIDGKYVIVYIANDGAKNHGPNQRIGMLISDNINGPWLDIPNENTPLLSPPKDSTIWCFNSGIGVNNPSIIKHPNGKYYLYFKAMSGPRPKGKVSMGLAIADNLKGPYIIQKNPIVTNKARIEDGYAFIWRNHICLLTTDNHGILEKGGGLLWVSDDGLKFQSTPLSGFHNFRNFYLDGKFPEGANARYGKNIKFERPQLLMDEDNNPEFLYCPCGVALDGSDGTNSYVLKYKNN